MDKLLKEISIVSISLGEELFSNAILRANWLGNEPASEEEISFAEHRLGISFPEDYRRFLKITNGFATPSNSTEPAFEPLNEVGYLKDLDQELIDIWSEHPNLAAVAEQLARSIRIGGANDEQHFFLIPPFGEDKKWKYWKFASWIPGEEEYNSLDSYFREVLDFLKN